jgi:hypothetical protein
MIQIDYKDTSRTNLQTRYQILMKIDLLPSQQNASFTQHFI